MRIVVLDTETTGDEKGSPVVEYAHDLDGALFSSLVDPECTVPSTATAIHHITTEMVIGAPRLDQVLEESGVFTADVCVAHFAAFDRDKLPALEEKAWICTYKAAMHLWPQAPSHKLQALRYWLELEPALPRSSQAHRALYDVAVCRALFDELRLYMTVDEMVEVSSKPLLLSTCRFGKHFGQPWREVPKSYLQWILRDGKFDEDTVHTARYWLDDVSRVRSVGVDGNGQPQGNEADTTTQEVSSLRGTLVDCGNNSQSVEQAVSDPF